MQIYQKNNSLVLLQRDAKGSFKNASLFKESELSPQEYGIREATLRGYSGLLRTLNVELLPFNPLRGLTVVKRSAVLNGIFQASTLTPSANGPKHIGTAPANSNLYTPSSK